MRKFRSATFTGVSLAMLVVAPAAAQRGPSISVNSGMTAPTGDGGDFHHRGFNVGATYEFDVSDHAAVQFHAAYHGMRLDSARLLVDSDPRIRVSGGKRTATLLMMNTKGWFELPGPNLTGFALLGFGLFRWSVEDIRVQAPWGPGIDPGGLEWALGVGAGAGIDARLNDAMSIFGQVDYLVGFTEVEQSRLVPVRFGLRFALPQGMAIGRRTADF